MGNFSKGNLAVLSQNVKSAYTFDQRVPFLSIKLQGILTQMNKDLCAKNFNLSVCNTENRGMVE